VVGRKFDPAHAERLVSEERRRWTDPDALVARLGVRRGDTLADIGCGPGFYTLPLARAAAPGTVWGFDVQAEMVRRAHERAAHEHVPNARFALVPEVGLPVEDGVLDGAFCACVLHEAEQPDAFLAEIRRALKPAGWLCLIEWHKRPMDRGPAVESRLSADETRALLAAAGFEPRADWELADAMLYVQLVARGA